MLTKYLCLVSKLSDKQEITSYEIEATTIYTAKDKARTKYLRDRMYGRLQEFVDVAHIIEVVEL